MMRSRAGRLALGLLITIGVMVVAVLPPGIHFVTAPLAPAIAGYVVGSRFRYSAADAGFYALILGVLVAGAIALSFERIPFVPSLSPIAVGFFAIVTAFYVGGLAGIAAGIAGSSRSGD